jgi:hypothetical protein
MGTVNVLAIDPGASTGWAWFFGGGLMSCGRIEPECFGDLTVYASGSDDVVIIECPRAYPRGKVDPNDLISLARKVGRLEQLFHGAVIVYPATWKGSLTKAQCHRRYLGRLTPADHAALAAGLTGVPASAEHDVLDAVCLGLWRLARAAQ